jgi:hypothetical protein
MERCEVVGGDFFQSVPAASSAYVLKRVLHDWNDDQPIQIIHRCQEAMARDGRVLTIEGVIQPETRQTLKDSDVLVGMALSGGGNARQPNSAGCMRRPTQCAGSSRRRRPFPSWKVGMGNRSQADFSIVFSVWFM